MANGAIEWLYVQRVTFPAQTVFFWEGTDIAGLELFSLCD
jgi:hypothetical protein